MTPIDERIAFIEAKTKEYGAEMDIEQQLLIAIYRELREANKMAREGLDFSNALSKQMLDNQQ